MHILEQLGVALGLASLAGINLYLTVLLAGLAIRFDWLHLAAQHQSLEVLGHPVVLFVAGILFCLEFFADKVPWIDSLWDSVHTFIRPVGGVLLGLEAVGEMPLYVKVTAALLAGGAALTTHSTKAGTRLLVNQSPEPVSNVAVSVSEDVAVVGGVALTLWNPMVALATFGGILCILWMLLPKLWRASRATVWLVWKKLRMPGMRRPLAQPVELPRRLNDDLRDLLQLQVGIDENEVVATVRCLSGKGKGIRGLSANLAGVLVLTREKQYLHFAASKGLSDRVFRLPLDGVDVQVDSRFLSENLVLEGAGYRAVFRFPRGEGDMAETVAMNLAAPSQVAEVEIVASEPVGIHGGKSVRIRPGSGTLPSVDSEAPTTPMMKPITPGPASTAGASGSARPASVSDKLVEPEASAPAAGVETKGPLLNIPRPMVVPKPTVSSDVVLRPLDDPPAFNEVDAAKPEPAPVEAEKRLEAAEAPEDAATSDQKKETLPAFPVIQ